MSLPCAQAEQSVGSQMYQSQVAKLEDDIYKEAEEKALPFKGGPGAHGAAAAPGEEVQQGDQAAKGECCLLGAKSLRLPSAPFGNGQLRSQRDLGSTECIY